MRRLSRQTDRPFTQLLALKVIDKGEVRSQAALAEQLVVDAPAVSRLVDRLVDDGLLKRCPGEDRRCVRLEVTDEGRAELPALRAASQWLEDEVRKHLTAQELKTLQQLLDKLQEGLVKTGEALSAQEGQKAE
ncbi:MarR family winged helix-turn-helix transcriptional regulator [Hyalangium rubrum]|uniref:MarR family transcriptional regulator n=1 Tax=Hyalangium rubrum TaxID=3103134 RepID=A0ABU5GV67_9BACT|nr:MarR family transcriptional regulator [Hyalangium sp. s54d21]MDY7225064.1 MarR family transcriptional regulator [Hyalangium sp. s54d21]